MRDRPSSSGLFPALRLVVGVGGAIVLASGVVLTMVGVPMIAPIVLGAIGVVTGIWERTRYRSEAAERASAPPGPGGGEPAAPLDPRFRATDERFVDPTSGRVMRVYADPASGERRYRAEG